MSKNKRHAPGHQGIPVVGTRISGSLAENRRMSEREKWSETKLKTGTMTNTSVSKVGRRDVGSMPLQVGKRKK